MKQTAVEWLWEQYNNECDCLGDVEYMLAEKLFEQAKAMEKEQICNAYVYGAAYGIDVLNNLIPDTYYNETFKSE